MLLLTIFLTVLILGILAYRLLKRKKYLKHKNKLLQFELQIFPHGLKISLLPGQPMQLIKCFDSKEEIILSFYKYESPVLYQKFYNSIDNLIKSYNLFSVSMFNAEKCFVKEFTDRTSTHIRILYDNGCHFESALFRTSMPIKVSLFIESCKVLVQKTFDEVPHLIHTKEEEETKLLERVLVKTDP